MSRTTPEDTFCEAQTAMERGDWDGFFVCLAPDSLVKIAENGFARFLAGGDTTADVFALLCSEHAVPEAMTSELRILLQRIGESARDLVAHSGSSQPETQLRQSLRHKQIVDEYKKRLQAVVKAVPDLPRFTAALERAMRAVLGGGSVSSRLFVEEVLEDISIDGAKAWATRQFSAGQSEDVGFVRRKGLWYIRLFAKRPRKRRG